MPDKNRYRYDLAVIGHLCLDHVKIEDKSYPPRVGGPPIYVGLTARRLGLRTKIYSKIGQHIDENIKSQLSMLNIPYEKLYRDPQTTSYQLTYHDLEHRSLKLLCLAGPIPTADIISKSGETAIHVVAPIAGEVPARLLEQLNRKGAFLFIDVQGFIRRITKAKTIVYRDQLDLPLIEPSRIILKGSEEEIKALTKADKPGKMASLLSELGAEVSIITREDRGCILYAKQKNKAWEISSYTSIKTVDTTGAGDAFTAGFIKGLLDTRSLIAACKYGNATASFIIETYGPSGFPFPPQVRQRAQTLRAKQVPV
ncbi:MAG: carbohydrate kinase family protein [Candidatus Ranarchaeia archaeon]